MKNKITKTEGIMRKSILRALKFTVITAIAVTAALVCAGCVDNGVNGKSPNNNGLLDELLGTPAAVCKINFDSQGGSDVGPQDVNRGSKVTKPADPTRTGYTLDGWSLDKGGSREERWEFNRYVAMSDTTLYAQWTPNRYTVTLDLQGGDGRFQENYNVYNGGKSVYVNYDNTVPTPYTSNRYDGYTFDGWYTDTEYTYQWKFTTDVVTSNITLYAKWTLNMYTVTFNAQGGSGRYWDSQVVPHGSKVTRPDDPDSVGYNFECWHFNSYRWNFDRDIVTRDTTLYAIWTRIRHTVTFDSKGGSAVDSKVVGYGEKTTTPSAPSRSGYTFGGWYKDAEYADQFSFTTEVITSDITVYAKWNLIKYKVTFDPNGGNVTPQSDSTGEGYTLASLPTPTRTDVKFDGWFTTTTGDTAVTTETRFRGNTTIYARWVGVPTPNKTTFTDGRDGKTYNKVKIGTQVWMAEDLRYNAGTYRWSDAKTACPEGWHLPTDAEWTTLVSYVGGVNIAGKKLKSVTGNGTDEYGFSALPNGSWWSATKNFDDYYLCRSMDYNSEYVGICRNPDNWAVLLSVRCVAD